MMTAAVSVIGTRLLGGEFVVGRGLGGDLRSEACGVGRAAQDMPCGWRSTWSIRNHANTRPMARDRNSADGYETYEGVL